MELVLETVEDLLPEPLEDRSNHKGWCIPVCNTYFPMVDESVAVWVLRAIFLDRRWEHPTLWGHREIGDLLVSAP